MFFLSYSLEEHPGVRSPRVSAVSCTLCSPRCVDSSNWKLVTHLTVKGPQACPSGPALRSDHICVRMFAYIYIYMYEFIHLFIYLFYLFYLFVYLIFYMCIHVFCVHKYKCRHRCVYVCMRTKQGIMLRAYKKEGSACSAPCRQFSEILKCPAGFERASKGFCSRLPALPFLALQINQRWTFSTKPGCISRTLTF